MNEITVIDILKRIKKRIEEGKYLIHCDKAVYAKRAIISVWFDSEKPEDWDVIGIDEVEGVITKIMEQGFDILEVKERGEDFSVYFYKKAEEEKEKAKKYWLNVLSNDMKRFNEKGYVMQSMVACFEKDNNAIQLYYRDDKEWVGCEDYKPIDKSVVYNCVNCYLKIGFDILCVNHSDCTVTIGFVERSDVK